MFTLAITASHLNGGRARREQRFLLSVLKEQRQSMCAGCL